MSEDLPLDILTTRDRPYAEPSKTGRPKRWAHMFIKRDVRIVQSNGNYQTVTAVCTRCFEENLFRYVDDNNGDGPYWMLDAQSVAAWHCGIFKTRVLVRFLQASHC